jgi:hypothetical protein
VRLEAAFCDVHPNQRLAQAVVKLGTHPGTPEQKALHCTRAGCNRHFHYDFGYFPFIAGEEPDYGDLKTKPKCRNSHDLIYMLLTKIDGEHVYACFHPECTKTEPFEARGSASR